MVDKISYLECQCAHPIHMIRLIRDDEYNEKSMLFHLVKYKTFWQRVCACFNYLFFYGDLDYDSYLLKDEDKAKFEEWLNE